MIRFVTFEADSFPVILSIIDEATGAPLNMDGITWIALAQERGRAGNVVEGQTTVLSAGELLLRFEAEDFKTVSGRAGIYDIQVRGTRGDDVQTLRPTLRVEVGRSIVQEAGE